MSSVGRKSNAIFALPGHGSTSSVGRKSNTIFVLPGHGSTSSVGSKSNAIFALTGHESTSSVGRKSNAIIALPDHGSTSSVARKSNAIFALLGHESTSSVSLYYTGSAFIIINPSHHPLVRNEREWVDPGAPALSPLLTGSSLLAALFKAQKDDERHQESRQDWPDQIMHQHPPCLKSEFVCLLQLDGLQYQTWNAKASHHHHNVSNELHYSNIFHPQNPETYLHEMVDHIFSTCQFPRSKLVFVKYQYLSHYLPPHLPPDLPPDLPLNLPPNLSPNFLRIFC
ncbi:hypothetical protein Tco_1239727 [Tanacetum coccineum]